MLVIIFISWNNQAKLHNALIKRFRKRGFEGLFTNQAQPYFGLFRPCEVFIFPEKGKYWFSRLTFLHHPISTFLTLDLKYGSYLARLVTVGIAPSLKVKLMKAAWFGESKNREALEMKYINRVRCFQWDIYLNKSHYKAKIIFSATYLCRPSIDCWFIECRILINGPL